MTIEYATGLDIGNRKRRVGGTNEDSVAVNVLEDAHLDTSRQSAVFVLADGAGGEAAGDIASYIATVEVAKRLTDAMWDLCRFDSMVPDGLSSDAIDQFDEATVGDPLGDEDAAHILSRIETVIQSTHTLLLQTIDALGVDRAYTTIVAGIKTDDRLYYGWVGDSRAYVVNGHPDRSDEDRISLLTRDHSVVERLLQNGEINPVEAHVHRQGHQLTRALGGTRDDDPVESTVDIETNWIDLYGDDTVVFTSDGLIDAYVDAPSLHEEYRRSESPEQVAETILAKSVTDDEICDVVLEADSLEKAARDFVMLANQRGGKDNISVILFSDPTLPPSPGEGLTSREYNPATLAVEDLDTVIGDPDP